MGDHFAMTLHDFQNGINDVQENYHPDLKVVFKFIFYYFHNYLIQSFKDNTLSIAIQHH